MAKDKYAVSLGAYAPCADRFVTAGYHPELSPKEMLDQLAATEGVDTLEMHFPLLEVRSYGN